MTQDSGLKNDSGLKITNKKVLIIDKMHESLFPMLERIGFEADYRPGISQAEVKDVIGDYEVMFVRSKITVDEELLRHAISLKVIGRAGAGIDQLDVKALEDRHIRIINAPEGNRDAVAEHALGMLLGLFNKILIADAQVRKGVWDRERNRGIELKGKTVGIVGYGCMGEAFAQRLQGFGCKIMAYDKVRSGFGNDKVEEVGLEKLREEADVVSFHIPLSAENKNLVDSTYLDQFRKSIYLINTARGEILPLEALRIALENGKVKGAALDVLENEKLHQLSDSQKQNFDYLVKSDRVILTPHVAGWTHESYVKINEVLVEKLKNLL